MSNLLELVDPDYHPISNMSTILGDLFTGSGRREVVRPDDLKYPLESRNEGREIS